MVRIKLTGINGEGAADKFFRLYGNESMAVPLHENEIGYYDDAADNSILLSAGTYYVEYGVKLKHHNEARICMKVMIGAIPMSKAVEFTQTISEDKKSATINVNQKIATNLSYFKYCEGKVTQTTSGYEKIDATNSFTVTKNGWYTILIQPASTVPFNKTDVCLVYVNVTGIAEPAVKGVTYEANNLKYKVVKEGIDGKGTGMVTGIVKQKSSVTIPKTVTIQGYKYKVVKINNKAFNKKSKIKTITIKSTSITSIGKNAFKGINKKATFKVPKSTYSKYKKLLTSKTGFAKKTMKIKKQ